MNPDLAGVAQWTEHWPANQKFTGSIPSQHTCLGCRRSMYCSHIDVSLPLFLSPFPSA